MAKTAATGDWANKGDDRLLLLHSNCNSLLLFELYNISVRILQITTITLAFQRTRLYQTTVSYLFILLFNQSYSLGDCHNRIKLRL